MCILIVFPLLGACRRRTTPEETGAVVTEGASVIEKQDAENVLSLKKSTSGTPAPEQEEQSGPDINLYRNKRKLLPNEKLLPYAGRIVVPEDMVIGPLAGGDDYSLAEQTVLDLASSMLSGMAQGEIRDDLFYPEWKAIILRSLAVSGFPEITFRSYRIGFLNRISQDAMQLNLRLFSDSGRTEGEIFVERKAGKWYITDLQIDFEKLRIFYDRGGKVFQPYIYNWRNING